MKLLSFVLLMFAAFTGYSQMTTTAYIRVSSERLPDGFPQGSPPSMLLPKTHKVVLDMPISLDNADDSLAVVAIKNAVVDSLEQNYYVQDFRLDTSLASTCQALITNISREWKEVDVEENPAQQYGILTPVFRTWVTVRWRKNP